MPPVYWGSSVPLPWGAQIFFFAPYSQQMNWTTEPFLNCSVFINQECKEAQIRKTEAEGLQPYASHKGAKRMNEEKGHHNSIVPCKLLFSLSILMRRICSMMAFRHRALSSWDDFLRPTISAHDALWGIPNSGSDVSI